VKPFLAIPLYKEDKYVFELEEYQEENNYINFEEFNSLTGQRSVVVN